MTARSLPSRATIAVLLIGLVLTGAVSWLVHVVNDHSEARLLGVQARDAASLLTAVIPEIETPLASAAEIASLTDGDPRKFSAFVGPHIGKAQTFVSVSLWKETSTGPVLVKRVGREPVLAARPEGVQAFFAEAEKTPLLAVTGVLNSSSPRIGYAFTPHGKSPWVVYAESALPLNRRVAIAPSSPFSDLRYAVYLGRAERASQLVATSEAALPLTGAVTSVVVPFGNSAFTLVASPAGNLAGGLAADLAGIVAAVGAVVTIAAALVAERLVRRRRFAERLAAENRRLYGEQHSIAEKLQQALLPLELPAIAGMELAARYIAGAEDVDVGGDWYDVIRLDSERFLFVVGDVSGRGLQAATVMARLHFATRAYASDGDGPADILRKIGALVNVARDDHFATVMCGEVNVAQREVIIANAGHPPALLFAEGRSHFLSGPVGPPVGVDSDTIYETGTFRLPRRATLLVFTDGLVERRGEHPDIGFERLQETIAGVDDSLDRLLGLAVARVSPADSDDDTVILGLRWLN